MDLIIFDGSKQKAEIKKSVIVTNFNFKRDLTQLVKSSCDFFEESQSVDLGDILLFRDDNNYTFLGKVVEVKNEKNKTTLSFTSNIDIFTEEYFLANNYLDGFNIQDDFLTCVELRANSSSQITGTDNNLSVDTLLRQASRRSPKKEYVTLDQENDKIYLNFVDSDDVDDKYLRYDDPAISYSLVFGEDTFNWLRWRNQDNKEEYADYFLLADGTISQDINLAQRPLLQKVEFVEADKWNDISKATTELKSQVYNNKLEIKTTFNTKVNLLKFDEYFLSKKLYFITPNENLLTTFISGVEIKNNLMTVTCGLTRTKLTDKLNRDLEAKR